MIDFKWISDNATQILVVEHILIAVIYFCSRFINNLLTNCPFLQADKGAQLIQGVFNALVQTITKPKSTEGEEGKK